MQRCTFGPDLRFCRRPPACVCPSVDTPIWEGCNELLVRGPCNELGEGCTVLFGHDSVSVVGHPRALAQEVSIPHLERDAPSVAFPRISVLLPRHIIYTT